MDARDLVRRYDGVSIRLTDATTLTQRQLENAAAQSGEGEITLRAAWSRGAPEQASSALNETVKLRRIRVYGDMRQVAPMELIAGSVPAQDDTQGCLIDSESAMALFHAADPIGAEVLVGGDRYRVRGVGKTYEPMLLIRERNTSFQNLECSARDLETARQSAGTYLLRCGAAEGQVVLLGGMLSRVLNGLFWSLPGVFGFALALRFFGRGKRCQADRRERAAYVFLGAAFACAAWIEIRSTAYLPQAWLPTKWSDFSFWSRLIEGWQTDWKTISLMTPLPKDVVFFQKIRFGIFKWLLALLLGGWGLSLFGARGSHANGCLSADGTPPPRNETDLE